MCTCSLHGARDDLFSVYLAGGTRSHKVSKTRTSQSTSLLGHYPGATLARQLSNEELLVAQLISHLSHCRLQVLDLVRQCNALYSSSSPLSPQGRILRVTVTFSLTVWFSLSKDSSRCASARLMRSSLLGSREPLVTLAEPTLARGLGRAAPRALPPAPAAPPPPVLPPLSPDSIRSRRGVRESGVPTLRMLPASSLAAAVAAARTLDAAFSSSEI